MEFNVISYLYSPILFILYIVYIEYGRLHIHSVALEFTTSSFTSFAWRRFSIWATTNWHQLIEIPNDAIGLRNMYSLFEALINNFFSFGNIYNLNLVHTKVMLDNFWIKQWQTSKICLHFTFKGTKMSQAKCKQTYAFQQNQTCIS